MNVQTVIMFLVRVKFRQSSLTQSVGSTEFNHCMQQQYSCTGYMLICILWNKKRQLWDRRLHRNSRQIGWLLKCSSCSRQQLLLTCSRRTSTCRRSPPPLPAADCFNLLHAAKKAAFRPRACLGVGGCFFFFAVKTNGKRRRRRLPVALRRFVFMVTCNMKVMNLGLWYRTYHVIHIYIYHMLYVRPSSSSSRMHHFSTFERRVWSDIIVMVIVVFRLDVRFDHEPPTKRPSACIFMSYLPCIIPYRVYTRREQTYS